MVSYCEAARSLALSCGSARSVHSVGYRCTGVPLLEVGGWDKFHLGLLYWVLAFFHCTSPLGAVGTCYCAYISSLAYHTQVGFAGALCNVLGGDELEGEPPVPAKGNRASDRAPIRESKFKIHRDILTNLRWTGEQPNNS